MYVYGPPIRSQHFISYRFKQQKIRNTSLFLKSTLGYYKKKLVGSKTEITEILESIIFLKFQ